MGGHSDASDDCIRMAFGSCNRQNLPQTFWHKINQHQPQAFLWSGDAVYTIGNRKGAGNTSLTAYLAQSFRELSEDLHYANFVENLKERKLSSMKTAGECDRSGCESHGTVYGIYDDHDLGVNDGGKDIEELDARRALFQRFLAGLSAHTGVGTSTSPSCNGSDRIAACSVKDEPEIDRESYHTFILSPPDGSMSHSVRVIVLDTRYHRDPHVIPSVGSNTHFIYPYLPLSALFAAAVRGMSASFLNVYEYNRGGRRVKGSDGGTITDSNGFATVGLSSDEFSKQGGFLGDMLGEAQWRWFNDTLAADKDTVDFTVIVSSVQVFTSNPVVESWGHFPRAKERLFQLLHQHRPPGLVFLSGDVHHAELSRVTQFYRSIGAVADTDTNTEHISAYESDGWYERQIVEVTSSGLTHTCSDSLLTRYVCPLMLKYGYNYNIGGDGDSSSSTDTDLEREVPSGHRLTPHSFYIGRNYGLLSTRRCDDNKTFCLDVDVYSLESNKSVLHHTVKRQNSSNFAAGDWTYVGPSALHRLGRSGFDRVSISEHFADDGTVDTGYIYYASFPLWSHRQLILLSASMILSVGGLAIFLSCLRRGAKLVVDKCCILLNTDE